MAARVGTVRATPRAGHDARRTATRVGLLVAIAIALLVYGCPGPSRSDRSEIALPRSDVAVSPVRDSAPDEWWPAGDYATVQDGGTAAPAAGEGTAVDTSPPSEAAEPPEDDIHAALRDSPARVDAPAEVEVTSSEPIVPEGTLLVAGAGVGGASLRTAPGSFDVVKVWGRDTAMVPLGEEQRVDNVSWTKVRDPDGNAGWVSSSSLSSPAAGADTGSGAASSGVARAGFVPPPPASTGPTDRASGPAPSAPPLSTSGRAPASGPRSGSPAGSAAPRPAGASGATTPVATAPTGNPIAGRRAPSAPAQTSLNLSVAGSRPPASAPAGPLPAGSGGSAAAPTAAPAAPSNGASPASASGETTPTPLPAGNPTPTPPVLILPKATPTAGTGRAATDTPLPAGQRNDPACATCHVGR